MAPTILNPGRAATCLTTAAPIGPSPKCITRMFGIVADYSAGSPVARRRRLRTAAHDVPDTTTTHASRRPDARARRVGVSPVARSRSRNEDVIGPKLAGSRTRAELRHHLMTSAEFQRQEPRFRAHQRSDGRDQGDRAAARGCSSISPTTSSASTSSAATTRRTTSRFVRSAAEARRHGDRCRRAHRLLHDAHGGGGRSRGTVYAFEPFDAQRRPAGAIDRRKPLRRSSRVPPRRRRRSRRHRHADLSGGNAEHGRRLSAARRHGAARRQPDNGRCRSSRSTSSTCGGRFASSRWTSKAPSRWSCAARARSCTKTAGDPVRAAPDAARTRRRASPATVPGADARARLSCASPRGRRHRRADRHAPADALVSVVLLVAVSAAPALLRVV